MRVLYIGGTGEISFDCVHESVRLSHDVSVFNRGHNNDGLPASTKLIVGDVADDAAYGRLAKEHFDVVCQFRLFSPAEILRDIALFTGSCGRYVFISSASVYAKPVRNLPITEATAVGNPHWAYSRDKAEMESLLRRQKDLPYTIVRPSHTYRTRMPTPMGNNVEVSRLLRGKPVVVHGDGESLWTVTHAKDFARPFARLLGESGAEGETFHLTSDRQWSWNEIFEAIAAALEVERPTFVHVASDTLVRYRPKWEGPLLGDKSPSVRFDNSKVKSVVGDFDCPIGIWEGARMVAGRYSQRANEFDVETDELLDRIVREERGLAAPTREAQARDI